MSSISKRVEMLPAKRRALILEYLVSHGATPIAELASAIGGSQSTVRRDLEHLMERGYLERTHGGALLIPPSSATFSREPSITAHIQRPQKIAIGRAAAQRLNPRESVIFEAGSTVLEAARAASTRDIPLSVITNSLDIAQICSAVPIWRVMLPGGTIIPESIQLAGEPAHSFFKNVNADVCFTGTGAVTGTRLTDASFEVAALKRGMIESARRTILLVDSSKFTAPAFCTFCELAEIDEVITDEGISAENLSALRSIHPAVTVVPVGDGPEEAAIDQLHARRA
jgi:DeoR/GlpR family transcriptional regulator of sugar metabolism